MSDAESSPRLLVGLTGVSRIEAFSDGVLAIVMTLLVLDLKVPAEGQAEDGLAHYLAGEWPSYVAYLASFLVVGIIWLNHHAVIGLLERADHGVRVLNLLLLAAVSVIPFPTALLSDFAGPGHSAADRRVAVVAYGVVMVVMSVMFNLLWRRIRSHDQLRRPELTRADLQSRHRRFNAGLAGYPIVTLVGLIDVRLFLAGIIGLAVLYLLPPRDPSLV